MMSYYKRFTKRVTRSVLEVGSSHFYERPELKMKKIFLCLKIAGIDTGGGGQFWVEKNDSGHKNSFF